MPEHEEDGVQGTTSESTGATTDKEIVEALLDRLNQAITVVNDGPVRYAVQKTHKTLNDEYKKIFGAEPTT